MSNNNTNDGGPAFPNTYQSFGDSTISSKHKGMSLRDYFAAHAPVEAVDSIAGNSVKDVAEFLGIETSEYKSSMWATADARARYLYADAMLAEREKQS